MASVQSGCLLNRTPEIHMSFWEHVIPDEDWHWPVKISQLNSLSRCLISLCKSLLDCNVFNFIPVYLAVLQGEGWDGERIPAPASHLTVYPPPPLPPLPLCSKTPFPNSIRNGSRKTTMWLGYLVIVILSFFLSLFIYLFIPPLFFLFLIRESLVEFYIFNSTGKNALFRTQYIKYLEIVSIDPNTKVKFKPLILFSIASSAAE